MAAGFTMKKNNLKLLDDFIQNEYLKKISHVNQINEYDLELSASAINIKFLNLITMTYVYKNGKKKTPQFISIKGSYN